MNRRSLFKRLVAAPAAVATIALAEPKSPQAHRRARIAKIFDTPPPYEAKDVAGEITNDLLERIYKQMQESAQDVWIDRHRQAYYVLHTSPNP